MADDYKEGEMDITEQEKTFERFVSFTVWSVGIIVGILVFLALFAS